MNHGMNANNIGMLEAAIEYAGSGNIPAEFKDKIIENKKEQSVSLSFLTKEMIRFLKKEEHDSEGENKKYLKDLRIRCEEAIKLSGETKGNTFNGLESKFLLPYYIGKAGIVGGAISAERGLRILSHDLKALESFSDKEIMEITARVLDAKYKRMIALKGKETDVNNYQKITEKVALTELGLKKLEENELDIEEIRIGAIEKIYPKIKPLILDYIVSDNKDAMDFAERMMDKIPMQMTSSEAAYLMASKLPGKKVIRKIKDRISKIRQPTKKQPEDISKYLKDLVVLVNTDSSKLKEYILSKGKEDLSNIRILKDDYSKRIIKGLYNMEPSFSFEFEREEIKDSLMKIFFGEGGSYSLDMSIPVVKEKPSKRHVESYILHAANNIDGFFIPKKMHEVYN